MKNIFIAMQSYMWKATQNIFIISLSYRLLWLSNPKKIRTLIKIQHWTNKYDTFCFKDPYLLKFWTVDRFSSWDCLAKNFVPTTYKPLSKMVNFQLWCRQQFGRAFVIINSWKAWEISIQKNTCLLCIRDFNQASLIVIQTKISSFSR